jgi:glycosyltransferase involved in cell wall biosynthesis
MSRPSSHLVSVVCAVHNGERFLAEAIASVMAQIRVDLELVVVDDGSTDGTPAILAEKAEDPRVRVLTQENRGVAAARNAGMAVARGDLIAFLDADDVWLPDKLQRQVELFDDRRVALAFTGYAITDESLRTRGVVLHGDLRKWLLLEGNGSLLSSSGMVRRDALASDLTFDEMLSISADAEFAWRAARHGAVASVRAPLVLYRTHDAQMHTDLRALERDVHAIYDKLFVPGSADDTLRRRGLANLYTRLAVDDMLSGEPAAALRHVRKALQLAPARLVGMPLGAAWRRTVRHLLRFLRLPQR